MDEGNRKSDSVRITLGVFEKMFSQRIQIQILIANGGRVYDRAINGQCVFMIDLLVGWLSKTARRQCVKWAEVILPVFTLFFISKCRFIDIDCCYRCSCYIHPFGSKLGHISSNGINSGLFPIRFQYILATQKVPDMSHLWPIRPTLEQP